MDLSLIPICNESNHILEYKYKRNLYCVICNRKGISNYCIHCDYIRCARCHKNIIDKERRDNFKNAIMKIKTCLQMVILTRIFKIKSERTKVKKTCVF